MGDQTTLHVDPSNAEQHRAWDGDEGAYWAANAARFDASVAAYHDVLLRAAGLEQDSTVLDVGCGTGQTTRDAARLAPRGYADGIDLSTEMLKVARSLAEEERVPNVRFLQADAQVHPFPSGSYDVVISRTGAMFFGDLVAAFSNVGRALRRGGRLATVAWQPAAQNEWFLEIAHAMAAGRDLPQPPPEAPGPFALSDPPRVTQGLTAAGYDDVRLEGLRAPMYFGRTADEAHELIAGLTRWMLEGLDDEGRRRALDALHATMSAHQTARGVELGSAMWLITARRP